MIVITAGFAMAYTVMKGGNVTVKILYDFLKQGQKNVVDILVALTGIGIWGIIGYASVWTMWKKGFKEGQTELLDIPYLPLKWVWVSFHRFDCTDVLRRFVQITRQGKKTMSPIAIGIIGFLILFILLALGMPIGLGMAACWFRRHDLFS